MQMNSRWSGPPVREVVWEAVQDFTGGDVNVEFAIKDIKAIILKKYPDFNVRTIGSQITAACVNSESRRYHPPGIDRYWKVAYGVYRLYVPNQRIDLDNVLEKINKIAKKSTDGDYIYRGEPECYDKVSSGLYRDNPYIEKLDHIQIEHEIELMQRNTLREAREYIPDLIDDFELLATLQHYGDKTNLIDFTTDYLVALFFACNRSQRKPGRVILLLREAESENYSVEKPSRTIRRADIQKSIFVQAPQGFVTPHEVVCIPADLKLPLLGYLHKHHDISTKTIYNDVHGFIEKRRLHRKAYAAFNEGFTSQNSGDAAKTSTERQKLYSDAIRHYTKAIDLNPDLMEAYYWRGKAWLHLKDWEKAKADLTTVTDMGPDIITAFFYVTYESVEDFEAKNKVKMPKYIAALLQRK